MVDGPESHVIGLLQPPNQWMVHDKFTTIDATFPWNDLLSQPSSSALHNSTLQYSNTKLAHGTHILDGSSDCDAHEWSIIGILICLRIFFLHRQPSPNLKAENGLTPHVCNVPKLPSVMSAMVLA